MFIYKGTRELLEDTISEMQTVNTRLSQYYADMEYVAMMSDVDLEEGENDEQEV